jgi:hypothetical protein
MSSAEDQRRAAADNRELLLQIIGSIIEGSLPLHLAVQLTPEVLRAMWSDADLELWRDFLAVVRHPGLLSVAMLAARLTAEQIFEIHGDPFALELVSRADDVVAGTELPQVLADRQREIFLRAKGLVIETRPRERLELLQFALGAALQFAGWRAIGREDPAEAMDVIRSSQSVILRGLDYLNNSARAQVEAALRALGPPTLEQIVRAAGRAR